MNRILQYDQVDFTPKRITQRDDPVFGPVTVFHDVVIAREIVHQYDDGWAYKPADELENAAWTADNRWVVIGRHPETAIVSSRNDIGGRTTNVRFTKGLNDPKTGRPNNRGILADIEVAVTTAIFLHVRLTVDARTNDVFVPFAITACQPTGTHHIAIAFLVLQQTF